MLISEYVSQSYLHTNARQYYFKDSGFYSKEKASVLGVVDLSRLNFVRAKSVLFVASRV